jgi:hypothetical protein
LFQPRSTWTKDVSAAEVAALVRAFIDTVLATPEHQLSPGEAAGCAR